MTIRLAAQPHSVLRSILPMALGAGGIPEPNFDRYASPWTCFADSDAGGEGGDGGAGGDGQQKPKTFTQEEVNAMIASRAKSEVAKLQAAHEAAMAARNAEFEELRIKHEETGKSAAEKERLAADRARAAIEKDLETERKARAADADALAKSRLELRDTRLGYELSGLFASKKAAPDSLADAVDLFKLRSRIEYDDEGKVVGVDYGAGRYDSIAKAVDAFWSDRGATFSAAHAGGAGTRLGNTGAGNPDLTEMSDDDLIKAGNAIRSARR